MAIALDSPLSLRIGDAVSQHILGRSCKRLPSVSRVNSPHPVRGTEELSLEVRTAGRRCVFR